MKVFIAGLETCRCGSGEFISSKDKDGVRHLHCSECDEEYTDFYDSEGAPPVYSYKLKDEYLKTYVPWPDVLKKATFDYYSYLVILKNGEAIRFSHAQGIPGQPFVTLFELKEVRKEVLDFGTERGVEISVRDIVSIVDAPS